VGQEHVVRTLSNAVRRGKVHHGYLFVGSRGTGKTSMAKILAACLNCERGPTIEPCGECDSCVSIAGATSLDVIEMDAASNNSVDDIRDLRERVAYAPVTGRHKVYILDEAHMLSTQAWNAFLKTLEEPPPRTIFVLATTEAHKVLPTVVDRCHRFDFGRPPVAQVATVLRRVAQAERIEIEEGVLALIARHATGSFRDALGTLEQLVTYTSDRRIEAADVLAVLGVADAEQLFGAVDAIVARDPAEAMRAADKLAASGRDPGQVLRDLEVHGRELLAVQLLDEVPPELRVTPERDGRLAEQARALAGNDAVRLLDLVSAALQATTNGAQARIQLELVLVKAAAPEVDPSTVALLARIERLEAALGSPGAQGVPAEPGELAGDPGGDLAGGPGVYPAGGPGVHLAGKSGIHPAGDPGGHPGREPAGDPATASIRARPTRPGNPVEPGSEGPAPLPDAPSANGSQIAQALELPALAELWPAVVEIVRQQNAMLAALLQDARPVAVDERELTLAFPAGAAFLKRKAEQDDHRRVGAQALRSVTGQALALRFQLREADGAGEPTATPVLSGEELVQRFVQEFDAEELLDDDPGGSNHDERKAHN